MRITMVTLDAVLGLDRSPAELGFTAMALRAIIVFVTGVVLLRLGARRSIGRNAGFDILLGIVLGSVLSRAVNGSAAFWPTLGASLVLVVLHGLLAWLTTRWSGLSRLVKGRPELLIRDGVIDAAALRRCSISAEDLDESLRVNGNVVADAQVAEARLERNGEISVLKAGGSDGTH
jgi:uncharacterized membrane protein YcaP (DUF421 family)